MELESVVGNIFGDEFASKSNLSELKPKDGTPKSVIVLNVINEYIKRTLMENQDSQHFEDKRVGRIGPKVVRFGSWSHYGLFVISPDRLSVNSQSNFSTMRANAGIYKGKWMYEVQLGSKGIMQVGWSTLQCKFNQQAGVGDTQNSYAYDGNRVKKWNVATCKYGEPWLSGDIIGCALDMDSGDIDFYRNGRPLGRAFENIPMGPGIAYFPTVSLALTESLTANFGSSPLRYPVKDYQTLQLAPKQQLQQAQILFQWFSKLLILLKDVETTENEFQDLNMSLKAFLMCITRTILNKIGPLLSIPYITEAIFIPFIENLLNLGESNTMNEENEKKLIQCMDLLWSFSEEFEMKSCLESTVVYLFSSFRHVSLLLEYPDQCKTLLILKSLCRHSTTRRYLLQYMLFDRVRLPNFVHVKPLDERGLADVIEKVWWETEPLDNSIETNKKDYIESCQKITNAISDVETLQVELLKTLLDNSDGNSTKPTSRTIFLGKLRRFVQENLISSRTMRKLQIPLPITLCCFHRLLVAFRTLWDEEVGSNSVYVPCRTFYDASINYTGIDRLGGVLSHLNKTFKSELLHLLGPEHEVIISMEQGQDPNVHSLLGTSIMLRDVPEMMPAFARIITTTGPASSMILERLGYTSYTREDRTPLKPGPSDPVLSLLELLDGIILFYHVAAKKQIAKVASLRDSMSEYVTAICEAKNQLEIIKKNRDAGSLLIQKELMRTINVFHTKLSEQARHMAWVRAAVYSEDKQSQLAWLLRVITATLKYASEEGNMFSYVPDFYLETLSDLSVGLRNHLHPTAPIEQIKGYQDMLKDVAEFLCDHFLDPRIVHASSKDTLILMLAGFVSNPLTLSALESVRRESRIKMVTNLLKPYENRAWAQSNWVLVRFWQGHGFAFRYEKSPHLLKKIGPKMLQQESISQPIKPCPSELYQRHVKEALLSNPVGAAQFLNSLLIQLNWAFSEFIGMVQEIHNVSSRPERVFIESRQLKICATCFDLTISLLRVLEMIIFIAPSIFHDPSHPSSDNLLARLCQLLCQILNRVSSQTSSFQHVVLLDIPDLETVDHFPILAAMLGILLALIEVDMLSTSSTVVEIPRVTQMLLKEPSFQMSSLYFVFGSVPSKNQKMRNIKPFSLSNYADDVTEKEITRVSDMLKYLETSRTILPEIKFSSDDEDICIICYGLPIEVTFEPCNHQSCRFCIEQHINNNHHECFFCKTTISRVIDFNGGVLHDFTKENV